MPEAASAICSFKQIVGTVATRVLPIPSPEIYSGSGSLHEVGRIMSEMGCRRPLIVTDKMLVKLSCVRHCIESLTTSGLEYELFDAVIPNPPDDVIERGYAMYQEKNCDGILAIGGGSPIDAAKIIGAKVANPKAIRQYEGLCRVTWYGVAAHLPPFVAIPTTAGTGSEVTVGAVVTLPEERRKITIADPGLVPKVAILDPEVLKDCPRSVLAATGMDALTHAIESFLSTWASPETRRQSLYATEVIFQNLQTSCGFGPLAQDTSAVTEAHTLMLRASFEAGRAITKCHVGYVHAIAHQFGGMFHTPHGEANTMVLAPVLGFYISDEIDRLEGLDSVSPVGPCCVKFCSLAKAAGLASHYEDFSAAALRRLAVKFVDKVETFGRSLGLPFEVKGMKASDVSEVARRALLEAHGEVHRSLPVKYILDLGYPVPKYMSQAECEAVVAQCLSADQRNIWLAERSLRTTHPSSFALTSKL